MSPLRSPSLRRRPRSPRALRMTAVLVAATLALSGCAMLQHPDATIGGSGVVTDSGSGSAAGTDDGGASVGDSGCSPDDATVTAERSRVGDPVVVAAERNVYRGSTLTDQSGTQSDGSVQLTDSTVLDDLGGDAALWTSRFTQAVRELTGDESFGDQAAIQDAAQGLQDNLASLVPPGATKRTLVGADVQQNEVFGIRIECGGQAYSAEVQATAGAVAQYAFDCAKPDLPKDAPRDELLGYCKGL